MDIAHEGKGQTPQVRTLEASDAHDCWVAITLAPSKKTMGTYNYWDRDMDTDLDRLKDLGTTTLVPLIEDDELAHLKIPNLVDSAKKRGSR